jgi:hypothetical protein
MASTVATPRPEMKPTTLPSAKERRIHNMPIGPIGALIRNPIIKPLMKIRILRSSVAL